MTKAKKPAAAPVTAAAAAKEEFDVENVMDHLVTRKRELGIGAIVVVVLAGGLLLWRMSVNQKNDRAETALTMSTNALYAGNRPLAASELQQVADRYRDTAPGVEAAMVLAQLDFEDARWADGLKVLEAIQASSQISNFKAPVDGLMAGAYADLKKYDDAIKHYQAASDESTYPSIKDVYQADAARIMGLAGKKDDAKKIWEALAAKTESPSVAEAKVRLGELEAAAATKN
jgi:predicted negative regulator of RcsB-dependent stress response